MKFAAIACLVLVAVPALSLPAQIHGLGSGSNDDLHLGSPGPKKGEPSTPSEESLAPPYHLQHDNKPLPEKPTVTEDKPGASLTHPDPSATTTSDARNPLITMPFNPALNLPFFVPTLAAPASTSSHPNGTTITTNGPTPTAGPVTRRRRSVPVKPGNARAAPLPAIIARDGSALPGINAEADG